MQSQTGKNKKKKERKGKKLEDIKEKLQKLSMSMLATPHRLADVNRITTSMISIQN